MIMKGNKGIEEKTTQSTITVPGWGEISERERG